MGLGLRDDEGFETLRLRLCLHYLVFEDLLTVRSSPSGGSRVRV